MTDERYESGEEGHKQVQRGRPENYIVNIRLNEKPQESMNKFNQFLYTPTLASKLGKIVYAKVFNDGNLLVRCANEEQAEKTLRLKEENLVVKE